MHRQLSQQWHYSQLCVDDPAIAIQVQLLDFIKIIHIQLASQPECELRRNCKIAICSEYNQLTSQLHPVFPVWMASYSYPLAVVSCSDGLSGDPLWIGNPAVAIYSYTHQPSSVGHDLIVRSYFTTNQLAIQQLQISPIKLLTGFKTG